MSRSGMSDNVEFDLDYYQYRGAVASAINGKRGQAFLVELIRALDRLPEKRLCAHTLQSVEGEVCAGGAVGQARALTLPIFPDPDDDISCEVADLFGVARALAAEVMFENDEGSNCGNSPAEQEKRWQRMRSWAIRALTPETLLSLAESTEERHVAG